MSAPAGFGKTLLLAEWAARHPKTTAWVSLDDDDVDDRRFWSALLAAFGSCPAIPAGNRLRDLAVPGRPSRDPDFLAAVVDAIGEATGPVRLVLDDVHELSAPDPLHGLAALVRDRPPSLHVVLSGRADPPLALARMRLSGQLREIRAGSLRFSVPEAAALLAVAGVPARTDQVRLLVEQTDGWPAGLRLAALSMRDTDDLDRFLSDLLGNTRSLSDYLVGEVLSRLPAGVRELLATVSVCDELAAPLAAALADRPDAGETLDFLERETSLVVRAWPGFRVQPLLRSHLRAELRRLRPDLVVRLHERATDWFDAAGQPVAALEHARECAGPERVMRLLRRHATALVAAGEHTAVREALAWLGDLPERQPWFALVAALVAIERGAVADADGHLSRADSRWPSDPADDLVALRELVRSRRAVVVGDGAGSLAAGDLAGLGLAPLAGLHQAIGLLGEGRLDEARATVESALRSARHQHHDYLVALGLTLLGAIAGADGDYRRMTVLAEAADAELADPGWRATICAAWSSALRAYGALLRADPAACLELVPDGTEDGTDGHAIADESAPEASDELLAMRLALRGAALFDLGRGDEGLEELRMAQLVAAGRRGTVAVVAAVAVLEHLAAARLGRTDVSRDVLGWARDELGPAGEVVLLRACRLAGRGRHRAASELLSRLLDGSVPVVLRWTLVEARVLACQLALQLDRRPQARSELGHALALAETMDVLRPLTSGPPQVIELLTRHMGSFGACEHTAQRVLAAHHALGVDAPPVALTERERAVLSLLPSQRSLEEIADDLTVSRSTVKTHVRSIYSKFGVSSRRDAVASARRHGILTGPTLIRTSR